MHTIEETKKSYDAACKEVLADRYILANILKECVEEFSGESIDYIATVCIQGSPEIGTIPVRADESVRLQLEGLNTEDTSLTEAVVHYDIRFRAILPREERSIKLIINVEAQNNFSPGYSLLKRAMYYCCRLVSAQYGTVFTHSSYDDMEKVYSIWICTNPGAQWEYTITKYAMQECNLIGKAQAKPEEYDLIVPIMVCLGKKKYRELQGLFRLLNMVLIHQNRNDRNILYPRMWTHRKKGWGKTLAKHCSDENGFRQCESFFMDRSRCRKFPLRLTEKPISMDSFKNVEFLEHGQSKKVWNPCNRTLV